MTPGIRPQSQHTLPVFAGIQQMPANTQEVMLGIHPWFGNMLLKHTGILSEMFHILLLMLDTLLGFAGILSLFESILLDVVGILLVPVDIPPGTRHLSTETDRAPPLLRIFQLCLGAPTLWAPGPE